MNTETENTVEIPDTISYNETDLDRPREEYRETGTTMIFKGVIAKAEKTVSVNKKNPSKSSYNFQLALVLRAVDSSDTVKGPELRYWVDIPVANPTKTGHKPFSSAKQRDMQFLRARELIRALEGSEALPQFPQKRDGQPGVYFDPATGENLTKMQHAALVKTIDGKTVAKLVEWYNNPSTLQGGVLYFGTKKKEGSPYVNVHYVRNDAGAREVMTENFTA